MKGGSCLGRGISQTNMDPAELMDGGFDASFHALTAAADAGMVDDWVPEITQRVCPPLSLIA